MQHKYLYKPLSLNLCSLVSRTGQHNQAAEMLQGTTGLLIKAMTLKKHLLAWEAFWITQTSDAESNLHQNHSY